MNRTFLPSTCGAMLLVLLAAASNAAADDWPTFQLNNRRNAVSPAVMDLASVPAMSVEWQWNAPEPPHPAWFGPAKWDAYAELKDLKSMRAYDTVYHVVVAEKLAYFSSSADDSVHCLYAENGQKKWVFTTGGPVRVPPTVWDGKIYFGSDDGHVYCLLAADGSLVWKYRPAENAQRILNDGRLISLWPCRSGVTVDRGIAYFTASLLPWNHGYLCALDAATGKVHGKQHFVHRIRDVTMEGPLALSATDIIVPQGRVAPILFSRADGSRQGSLKGGGGTFVVLSGEQVFHGPGNKAGWITGSDLQSRDVVATFKNANAMVIDGAHSFLLTSEELVSSDLEKKSVRWRAPTDCTHALIKVGDVMFLGGSNKVCAIAARTGSLLWEHAVKGTAQGLAMADGKLFVSTDSGSLYAFSSRRPGAETNRPLATSTATPAKDHQPPSHSEKAAAATVSRAVGGPKSGQNEEVEKPLAVGPWVQFRNADTAVLRWHSHQVVPSLVDVDRNGSIERIALDEPTRIHSVQLDDLPHRTTVRYRILSDGRNAQESSAWYELDTFFNYAIHEPTRPLGPGRLDRDKQASSEAAAALLRGTGKQRGLCVLMGLTDGTLAYELVKQSDLRVIAFETDQNLVREVRQAFLDAGLYGARFTCHHVENLAILPTVGDFANLVSSERSDLQTAFGERVTREAHRIACPRGTIAFRTTTPGTEEGLRTWFDDSKLATDTVVNGTLRYVMARKGAMPAAGSWTHIYGNASNALYDGESLGMARRSDQFKVQWLGRPGPRFQPDRNGRKPPPISAAGKLFLQGLQRIVAVDQYNGTVLWSLEIPDLGRFNIPRDCGNWCTDGENVYVSIRDRCWVVDAEDGEVKDQIHLPVDDLATGDNWDWGYVARTGDTLLGSSVRQGTAWKSFWGKSGWYDSEQGTATHKVCSDQLFALDADSGAPRWKHRSGLIINATVTATEQRVYFVECRNEELVKQPQRRLGGKPLWKDLYLVALDQRTGEIVAEERLTIVGGEVAIYLAHSDKTLVLVSSANKSYHVYAFSGECEPSWATTFRWGKGKADHGSHLSRPAIVGGKVFVRPAVLDLATGTRLSISMPVGGCGTYAATDGALFFRAGSGKNSAVWDSTNGDYTTWSRLRPDCWLSTIPVGGMLLSPEGGGGCSCGSWMETSIGFMPISRSIR